MNVPLMKQCDDSLTIIAKKYLVCDEERYFYKTFTSIYTEMKKLHPHLEVSEMMIILEKLSDDRYIKPFWLPNIRNLNEPSHYYISVEGRLHVYHKGYWQQEKKLNRKSLNEIIKIAAAISTLLSGIFVSKFIKHIPQIISFIKKLFE